MAKAPRRHARTGPPPGAPGGVLVTVRAADFTATTTGFGDRNGRYGGHSRAEKPKPLGRQWRMPSLHLDKLAPVDEEARERRNARLRWLGTRVGSVALTGLLVYAVFPVRTYLNQRSDTDRGREQLEVLSEENDRLEQRADELRDPETVEEIARRDHNLVMPGEEPYAIMPAPDQAPAEGDDTDGG
jgi:cell division protein FtsB